MSTKPFKNWKKPKNSTSTSQTDLVLNAFGGLLDITGKSAQAPRSRNVWVQKHRDKNINTGLLHDTRTLRKEATAAWTAEVTKLPSEKLLHNKAEK